MEDYYPGNNRREILDVLEKNNMNFYFYCPKEDINQRYKWRLEYKKNGSKTLKNLFYTQKKKYSSYSWRISWFRF